MVVVAQWQSSRLWSWLLRVRVPSIIVLVFFGGQVSHLLARDSLSEEVLAALIGGVGFAEVSA